MFKTEIKLGYDENTRETFSFMKGKMIYYIRHKDTSKDKDMR